jgi:hypothetical protein
MSDTNDSPALAVAEPLNTSAVLEEGTDQINDDGSDIIDEAAPEAAAIDAAAKAGDITKQQAAVMKKKLMIKVDGVESEEEIDFADEENLKKHLQKSKAFDKRLKEFSGYKSQVEQMLEMLKSDPEALLEKMGINVDELSEKRLSKKVDEMKKSPEQLKAEKMEKELDELRKEKKAAKDSEEKAQLENMRNQAAQQIEGDITSALSNAKSVLPKNSPIVLQRVAQTMLMAMQNGYPQVTAKDVIPLVEKQWKEELNAFFSVSSEDTLEALVGKTNLDKYRKAKITNKKAAPVIAAKQSVKDTGAKPSTKAEAEPKKYKMKDVFDFRK